MNPLGRIEDLPADYVAALKALNLVPLWPRLRALLPPDKPQPQTRATHWSYEALRPLLLKAGELAPIEGSVAVDIGDQAFMLAESDTCCAPGYTAVNLAKRSPDQAVFLFIADETPLHRNLGLFDNRG